MRITRSSTSEREVSRVAIPCISVFPSFTAPLPGGARPFRVIPNPNQLFADAFELGNPSHWSALGP